MKQKLLNIFLICSLFCATIISLYYGSGAIFHDIPSLWKGYVTLTNEEGEKYAKKVTKHEAYKNIGNDLMLTSVGVCCIYFSIKSDKLERKVNEVLANENIQNRTPNNN